MVNRVSARTWAVHAPWRTRQKWKEEGAGVARSAERERREVGETKEAGRGRSCEQPWKPNKQRKEKKRSHTRTTRETPNVCERMGADAHAHGGRETKRSR